MSNLIAYSLQVLLLVAVAALLPAILGMKTPGARLAYWQTLLAACLALPLLRSWKQEVVNGLVSVSSTVDAIAPARHGIRLSVSWTEAAWLLLAGGILVRIVWLSAGLWRLHRYRQHSRPFQTARGNENEAEADIRISDDVSSPVTFGFFRPVILLPARFPELPQPMKEAILRHETLHVQRRDWVFTVMEELIRAALWFHPAIWWVLAEIQLAREQVVDLAVIDHKCDQEVNLSGISRPCDLAVVNTRARDEYIDALLAIAGARHMDLSPAPLFLRKRHLKQRVISILKEVRMSRTRSLAALTAGLIMIAAAAWFVTGAIPLAAAPQEDAAGVSVELNGAQLMHRVAVNYPLEAIARRIEGTVVVQVKLSATGTVTSAEAVSGPEELRKAAVQSVSNWHFAAGGTGSHLVTIGFQLPARAAGSTVKSIAITGLTDQAATDLRARLPVHEGDTLTQDMMSSVAKAASAFDEHLVVRFGTSADGVTISIAPGSTRIRIGGNVQQANLLSRVVPPYPAEAKAQRIQGIVRFEVDISPEGKVEAMRLVSGPPLLVQAALEAVRQWTWKPTLLNGNPVAVTTTIDVNFTLSQ